MKANWMYALGLAVLFIGQSCAQEVKTKTAELRVNMEEVNGDRILTVERIEDGKVSKEVYKNEEADIMLESLNAENNHAGEGAVQKEVKMVEDENGKHLTVRTTENGKVTEEEFVGDAAEQKLKEMESEPTEKKIVRVQRIEKAAE